MAVPAHDLKTVLITGGTSGFGLELARELLNRDCIVVVTGRTSPSFQTQEHRFSFFRADFSNLEDTAEVIRKICKYYSIDIIVDNAGVLSPPAFMRTPDNLEYSFQVNFLAHLLLNEIVIKNTPRERTLTIVPITSPVYKIAGKDLFPFPSEREYRTFKAYSKSKLCLALMCSYLPSKFKSPVLNCIGFNPGIFRSGIYRMQKPWFRFLYKVAAPFMRNPRIVAKRLADLLGQESLKNGCIYGLRKEPEPVPSFNRTISDLFWKECYQNIQKYL